MVRALDCYYVIIGYQSHRVVVSSSLTEAVSFGSGAKVFFLTSPRPTERQVNRDCVPRTLTVQQSRTFGRFVGAFEWRSVIQLVLQSGGEIYIHVGLATST
jgi:hypothetical protein